MKITPPDLVGEVCLPADGAVTMQDGSKKIVTDLACGDVVFVPDENDPYGPRRARKILEIYHNSPQPIQTMRLRHSLSGQEFTVRSTPGHRFFVKNRDDYVHAEDIHVGEMLANGPRDDVELLEKSLDPTPVPVYNFQVEEAHTYFVGENDTLCVLSHNQGCDLVDIDLRYDKDFTETERNMAEYAVNNAYKNLKNAQNILRQGGKGLENLLDKWYGNHDEATVKKVNAYVDNIIKEFERSVNRKIIGNKVNLLIKGNKDPKLDDSHAYILAIATNIPGPRGNKVDITFNGIILGSLFFDRVKTSNEDRINTIIHELSHLYANGFVKGTKLHLEGLKDHGYWDPNKKIPPTCTVQVKC